MIYPFPDVGSIGLNKDLFPNSLPLPNQNSPVMAWSDAKNIRFKDGYAQKFMGHAAIYDPPSILPYYLLPLTSPTGRYWMYAGAGKIYAVSGSTHTDITKAATTYTGALNAWTGCVLTGVAILNNGVENPQYWAGNTGTRCQDLTNWPASTQCKVIRSYRNYLIALNVTKSGTNYPTMVKWSHPADPGTLPVSWDQTDPTKDAGEMDLADDQSAIVDGLQLGDLFVVYKETAIYVLQYIGAPYIFRFQKLTAAAGLLCRNAVTEFPGGHVFISQGDVMVLDQAGAPRSILTGRMRRYFNAALDSVAYGQSFCAHNPVLREVWVCYPKTGATVCTEAIVWNYEADTLALRDLPNLNHATCGVVDYTVSNSWNADTETWNQDTTLWNQVDYTQAAQRLVMASNDTKLFLADVSASFNGTAMSVYVERTGMDMGEPANVKTVTSIRPIIDAAPGTQLTIRAGATMDASAGIAWSSPITFTVGTDYKADMFATGRYLAMRIESNAINSWRLKALELEYEVQSGF